MNGSVARRIRKEVYGDYSFREARRYSARTKLKEITVKDKNGVEKKVALPRNTALSTGLRLKYRLAKKAHKEAARDGKRK